MKLIIGVDVASSYVLHCIVVQDVLCWKTHSWHQWPGHTRTLGRAHMDA